MSALKILSGVIAFLVVVRNLVAEVNVTEKSATLQDELEYYHPRRFNGGRRPCETEQIEYRLTKLEVQVGEKAEHVVSELREGNRRLQALEFQNEAVETALQGFRTELGRFSGNAQPVQFQHTDRQVGNDKLELRVDNLVKGVQLVVAALRGLNTDIAWVKRNISAITNSTSSLLLLYDELVTKQFLSNSLVEVKHEQYPVIPPHIFSGPKNVSAPKSCQEVLDNGETTTGIYQVRPEHSHRTFTVLCDMDTEAGGWTYIHNRYQGSQDFYLNWHDYKTGFGNLGGEFWLGLEHIYQLTGHEVNELRVELEDADGEKAYAHYAAFTIGSEVEGYALKVLAGYTGDAGDSLSYHAGSRFSTKDLDQDGWSEGHCAQAHVGAWWYRSCDTSNLNGRYLNGKVPESFLYQGMYWGEFKGAQYSLSKARMMIRPRGRNSPPIFPDGLTGNRRK